MAWSPSPTRTQKHTNKHTNTLFHERIPPRTTSTLHRHVRFRVRAMGAPHLNEEVLGEGFRGGFLKTELLGGSVGQLALDEDLGAASAEKKKGATHVETTPKECQGKVILKHNAKETSTSRKQVGRGKNTPRKHVTCASSTTDGPNGRV